MSNETNLDIELQAVRSCYSIIEQLPGDGQSRVLEWLRAKIVAAKRKPKEG